MINITLMKAVRDIWIGSLELRDQLAKRYPRAVE